MEPVEAVQKVIDEEEKLLESVEKGEETKKIKSKFTFGSQKKNLNKVDKIEEHSSSAESEDGKKSRKTFSFRSETKSTADEDDQPEAINEVKMEEKSSFFTRHWGKIRDGSDSKKQRAQPEKKAEEVVNVEKPEKPKKPVGIFKRSPKKSQPGSSSSDDDENNDTVRLNPEGDQDEITLAADDTQAKASANQNKKIKMVHAVYNEYTQFLRTNSKTKKSASVDELATDRVATEPEERGSNSDDESKSKSVASPKKKKEFFKLKGKKAVSVDVHQEVSQEEKKPTEVMVRNAGRNSGRFSFKNKRESTESHKSYENFDNEQDEFDEAFHREAERASKLKIIPKTKDKNDSVKRKSSEGKKKSATLDGHNTGSGFFKLGSRKKNSFSMDDVVLPEGPRNSLPEENKQKVKKYNVKKMTASFYSGEITSSDEQHEDKVAKRRARKPKQTNKSSHQQSGHSSEEEIKKEDSNVFKRMFRRSLTESKEKKEKRRSKRRSSLETLPIDVLLQQEAEKAALEQEQLQNSATVEHIYENFPLQQKEEREGEQKSTDEETDEYFAEYYHAKKEMSNARRSWSYVMTELKEKISMDGDVDGGSEPIYQMQVEGEDGDLRMETLQSLRLQEMKSDPNLADHRNSSSSEDELMMIKRSVEKLDRDYQAHVKEQMSAIQAIQLAAEDSSTSTVNTVHMTFEESPIQTLQITSEEQPKSIIEELIVPIKADDKPELPKVPPPPLTPTRSKNLLFRSSSSGSENSEVIVTVHEVSTTSHSDNAKQEANALSSSSDSLEVESLEPATMSGSFHTPSGSRQSTLSQDSSIDNSSKQDTNNNDGASKVELRNSSDKTLVWQSSSQLSTESRPLSDCQLKIVDTISFEVNQLPLIKRVVAKPSRRLERSSRVGKRPTSSYSSSNDDSASAPTSPVRKLTTEEEHEIKKSSTSSSSSKGESIPSSTEDLTKEDGNKENEDLRSSSYHDDVFIAEVIKVIHI